MNNFSVLLPKPDDVLLFEDSELKLLSSPNLLLCCGGQETGFTFTISIPVDHIESNYPDFFEKYEIDHRELVANRKLLSRNSSRHIAGIDAVIFMYDPTIHGDTHQIILEELAVYGKASFYVNSGEMLTVIFKGGLFELPSIEKTNIVIHKHLASKVQPKPKILKDKSVDYSKFEILDLS